MTMEKRFLVILLLLVFLAGCTGKQKTLVFAIGGTPSELDYWVELMGEFEVTHKVKVELLRQPTDTDLRRQGLVIALKSKNPDPDIFLMDVVWVGQFAASGWLQTLDPYIKEHNLDTDLFFDRVIRLTDIYDGSLIALPVYIDGGLLYYRKDLLKKYGFEKPPLTWQELIDYSLKIQQGERELNPHFYGFLWQGAQYEGLICNFLEFAVSSNGGILLSASGEGGQLGAGLNTPENRKALQLMHDLIHKYKISPPNTYTEMKEEEVRLLFQSGNALFQRNWSYAWALHQKDDSGVRGNVGIAPLPHAPKAKSASTLGGWHIGISKYSDNKEEAFKLLQFITSYDIQKRLTLELGWNPAHKSLYADKDVAQKMAHIGDLKPVFENAYPRPVVPYYTLISEILQRYLNAALSGKMSAEAALDYAEKRIRQLIKKYESE